MNNRSRQNHHRRKQNIRYSYLWAGIMAVCAIAILFIAVWVVITVYEKIAGDSSEWALESTTEESTELDVEAEEIYGWITDEKGSRYREDDGSFAADEWKIWENQLYYLDENGYMVTSQISQDGQIFLFSSDGALKDIQFDSGYQGLTGEDNLQNLDSLVKSNEFWSYLSSDIREAGLLKPIYYRKTAETKEEVLGDKNNPERSTKNSLQIHDGYIYYLPRVTAQTMNTLEERDKNICNKLFRMKPGEEQKELLAENCTGYLVLDDGIYYASDGKILKADQGMICSIGEDQYRVQVKDDSCYLVDSMGNPVSGDEMGIRTVGSRDYYLENGVIVRVALSQQQYDDAVFTLEKDTVNQNQMSLYRQKDGEGKVKIAQAPFGINSFCLAEDYLYYSAFVEQKEDGTRYSQIYRIKPDGTEEEKISSKFAGNILNLYYYEDKNQLYGEYSPTSWKNCYGQIVSVDLDGTVHLIDDSSSRGSADQNKNERLSLLMVSGNTITTYLCSCEYRREDGVWNVISKKPYQFSDTVQRTIADHLSEDLEETESETERESEEESSREPETTEASHPDPTQPQRPVIETPAAIPAPPTTAAPAPVEPGYAPTMPVQEPPGPGNSTIPTIEANPEDQVGPIPGNPSESVWYIGPGGTP